MTQAVTVRRDGDTFQARLFWWHAARLLDPKSPIVRVGFETGPKSFDDPSSATSYRNSDKKVSSRFIEYRRRRLSSK